MKKLTFFIIAVFALHFSGCGYYHKKMAERYLKKAEEISLKQEASQEELDSVYEYLSKALDHNPNLPKALEISEKTAQASAAGGYFRPSELNMELVNKYLKLNPHSWQVYLNLISAYSIKGDLLSLESVINKLNSSASRLSPQDKLTAKLLTAICYYNLIPWLQSEGYLSVNTNSDNLLSNLNRYSDYMGRARTLKEEIQKESSGLSSIDREITYAYEIAINEAFKDEKEAARTLKLYELTKQDQNYLKALKYTADGNAFLAKKEYANARVYYNAAINNYPGMINAKKQIIETDFQQAMSEALSQKGTSQLKETLYDCYQEIKDLIQDQPYSDSMIPFVTRDKFLSESYSLKAALLTAIMTLEDMRPAKKARVKAEIEDALNKSIELYPQNKMARDLFERNRKDGK
ncbi:MAG: hypothetical protein Fur0012_11180 [Elusimicrobiota bacterium]